MVEKVKWQANFQSSDGEAKEIDARQELLSYTNEFGGDA